MNSSIRESVLDLVGKTPILHLNRFRAEGGGEVFVKLEGTNPGGSIKDRVAIAMVDEGERTGRLRPGGTIVEPTGGNTGVGLALVGAVRGYNVILVVPDKSAKEKEILMRGLGARVVRTPCEGGMRAAIERARELVAEIPGAWMPQQFENPDNPGAHYDATAPEIFEQMEGRIDAVVIGAGTGGTVTGVARFMKERLPRVLVALVEPVGSVFGGGCYAPYRIEGIGGAFVPAVCEMNRIDRVIRVADEDTFATMGALARREGLLVGLSASANIFAAIQTARELGPGTRTVTVAPDGAERYLSKDPFGLEVAAAVAAGER